MLYETYIYNIILMNFNNKILFLEISQLAIYDDINGDNL